MGAGAVAACAATAAAVVRQTVITQSNFSQELVSPFISMKC